MRTLTQPHLSARARALVLLSSLLLPALAWAARPTPDDRKQILDAIRPSAEKQAGQAVRFKVDLLNQDGDWVALVGELITPSGADLDWDKAKNCHPDLDKMLWAVAEKVQGKWRVRDLDICGTEPPYWYLKAKDFARPCGIYAGMDLGNNQTAQSQCLAYKKKHRLP